MHKDWKAMFAAALCGEVARAGDERTYRIAIQRAGKMADLACEEIDRRENPSGFTMCVRLPEGTIQSEFESRTDGALRRMFEEPSSS